MYTEIKELVNFLAVYMHHRIPRRRVMFTDGICLCMESYANHLATKFHDTWSIDEPKYAESERVVAVKTSNGLDDMFSAVADALGIDMDDLYASFPPNMFAYCNPGEVTCRVSDFPTLVIVWRGGVEEDRNYIPIPIGAAKYYDGDSHNIRNTVLRALTFAHGGSHETATNRDIKPERCVPLDLISSAAIPAYDLLITGYIDVHKVPPILFRYTTSSKSFTVRSFAATRFGSHRPRPDHVAMRRIQHAAAYLAMMNDELMNAPAINNLQGNFHYMSAQDDRGRQYSLAVPFLPGTYPAPFAGYNQAVSAAEAPNAPSITYYQPNNTSSTYAANSGPVVSNPSNNFTMPAQYAAVYPPQAPAAVRNNENNELPAPTQEFGSSNYTCCYTTAGNNSVVPIQDGNVVPNYDIWKPVQTLPIDSCDGGTNPVNNYIFDVPPYHSEYTQHQVNPELPQEGTDTDMNELQQNLANFSFLDMSPQLTSPSLSPVQIFTPQISQACLSPVQVSSPQILTTQIPLVQVMPSQLPQASPLQVYPAQVSQPQLFSPQMSPQQVLPAQVLPAQVLQPQAIQPQVAPQQMLHPQVIPSQIVPTHVPIQHLSPPLVLQPQVSPPQIAPHLVLQQQISPPQIAPQLVLQPQVSSPQVLPPTVMQQGATPPYTMQVQVAPTCAPQSQDPLPNTADNSKAK